MFIGARKIKDTEVALEKTPSGNEILLVRYEDGASETFSKIMYDKIVSEEPIDDSVLRDKRVFPVVEAILIILREWGLKIGETAYLGSVLNRSLNYNSEEAEKLLWKEFLPTINSLDDIDTITIDKVLKMKKPQLKDFVNDDQETGGKAKPSKSK